MKWGESFTPSLGHPWGEQITQFLFFKVSAARSGFAIIVLILGLFYYFEKQLSVLTC